MLTLRQKFLIGSGLLVLLLLALGGLGYGLASRTTASMQRMLKANHESVVAMDGLGRVLDRASLNAADLAEGQGFIDFQKKNVTEEGEQELTDSLNLQWVSFARSPEGARSTLRGALRETVDKIRELNLKAMSLSEGRASQLSEEGKRWLLTLLALSVLVCLGALNALGRWVLAPLSRLTASVRAVESGNLEQVLYVESRDELGQLAEAFNAMTARLRELRGSDRAKLVRAQRLTRAALQNLRDAVALINAQGVVELANPVAKIFGLREGQPMSPELPAKLVQLIEEARRQGRAVEPRGWVDAVQAFDNGQERFFLPHLEPMTSEADGALMLVLVDVTGLRQLDEAKSSLVNTVSHELKTPLTGLRMALHLLLEDSSTLEAHQEELLQAARGEAERLREMVDGLLDMSRLEAGKGGLALKPIMARTLISEAMGRFKSAYRDKGIILTSAGSSLDERCLADTQRVQHVFSNLLDNALGHTPAGGQVSITVSPAPGSLRFEIKDSGEGIPPEHLPHVFDKFFRVPGKEGRPGAGLGLSIAKEIVEAHGGRLNVESFPGQGSNFYFTLPRG
jgi:NtrC-family two-component system sensor histidine kinase KinB